MSDNKFSTPTELEKLLEASKKDATTTTYTLTFDDESIDNLAKVIAHEINKAAEAPVVSLSSPGGGNSDGGGYSADSYADSYGGDCGGGDGGCGGGDG